VIFESSDRFERAITNTGDIAFANVILTLTKPMFVSQRPHAVEFNPAFTGRRKGARVLKTRNQAEKDLPP
jgi:hypothetical protein